MNRPNSIDAVEWARWNYHNRHYEPRPVVIRSDLSPEVRALTLAMRNAASELEGTGEKGDRVACQLLTALAKFAQETGT